ncbi:hypothetical protein [Natrinema hispanicum]|uniref:Uncharacterized protein n=1 Tax=Natrinema hispanicum TaxID=392421 RepID=A0A1I0BKP9_9EURY|nr:hypothetical protein [Natrinema hispanicum]SDC32948.1 hypothetical protein SAMN05192552_100332 [Natrinema hispanicum]SET07565.1 hypothetical protein SAMN04488694_103276 [Natrinema hispanicum]
MEPNVARRCHVLFGVSLLLLTIGIGYCVIVGTCLADFAVVVAGLFVGWIALFYCVGNATIWG